MKHIIRNISIIIIGVIFMIGTTGCVSAGALYNIIDWVAGFEVMKEYHASFGYVDEQMATAGNQIADALIAKDIDALKEIMSPIAVETEDFEKGFEYSCSFFDEEIVSREMLGCSNGTKQGVYRVSNSAIVLTTVNQNTIYVSFTCYFTHRREPEKIGIFHFSVYTDDSVRSEIDYWYYKDMAGIFNPEWNDRVYSETSA